MRLTMRMDAKSENLRIMIMIPARGGSQGVPRKALADLGGWPLISYTIRQALEIEGVDKVVINTDDAEIRDVALAFGAEAPFLRPAELARNDSNLSEAYVFQSRWYKKHEGFVHDVAIIMSPTHPFRRAGLIAKALAQGLTDPAIFNLRSIAPAWVRLDNYWSMSGGIPQPFFDLEHRTPPAGGLFQNAFSFNIVFETRADRLHLNREVPIMLNDIEAIDIDQPEDLDLARIVLKEGLYPFPDHNN